MSSTGEADASPEVRKPWRPSKTFEHVSPWKATALLVANWLLLAWAIATTTLLPLVIGGTLFTTYAWAVVMRRSLGRKHGRT